MNSLHDETLKWVGDGSDGNTLTQSGNDVEVASKSAGTPFNFRLDSEKSASDYFVNVEIKKLEGNVSLGAVRKDEFKSGWKTKGLFYNVSREDVFGSWTRKSLHCASNPSFLCDL